MNGDSLIYTEPMNKHFPFTAIYGQDDFRLALMLCMIDPSLGGVLALGDKGTGKTTTVRALSSLMQKVDEDFSFVNLPIGATEDRVLGTVKLDVLLNEKRLEIQKGLLASANRGILYIDEVNLLDDYLMDVLLDAASSGGYYLERDSISQWMPSRFCLIGTMNPEEGELRPQLKDRFGLSVNIKTPADKETRIEIINRKLAFDSDPVAFHEMYTSHENELVQQLIQAKHKLNSIPLPHVLKEEIAELCLKYQVEGLRADILLAKAARAHAVFKYQKEVRAEDVRQVMPFVLSHRSKHFSQLQNSRKTGEKQSPREEKEGDTKNIVAV